jgi:hypothetical protein
MRDSCVAGPAEGPAAVVHCVHANEGQLGVPFVAPFVHARQAGYGAECNAAICKEAEVKGGGIAIPIGGSRFDVCDGLYIYMWVGGTGRARNVSVTVCRVACTAASAGPCVRVSRERQKDNNKYGK